MIENPDMDGPLRAWLVPRGRRLVATSDLGDDHVEWMATIGLAARDYALPMLATVLGEAGLFGRVPAEAATYLDYALRANAEANGAIRQQILFVGRLLDEAGVCAVVLKGASWLFETGPAARDRMMRDIDLLVPASQIIEVRRALEAAGFRTSQTILGEEGHAHDRPLEHPDHPVSLEVHSELTTRPKLLSGEEMIGQAIPVARGLAIPSPAHRLLHNVIHGQLVNGYYAGGALDMRDAMDVGRLVRLGESAIDWNALADQARQRELHGLLAASLHQARFVAGCAIPAPFVADLGARRHLRRCLLQRRFPLLDRVLRPLGNLTRALAWERDAFALGLGESRGLDAHLKVNRRRFERAWTRLGRLVQR